MTKEIISSKQGISIIALFVVGSSLVLGGSIDPQQDSWIAFIIGFLVAVPFILMYARLIKLYPGRDIYDISIELFGNIIGKIIIALFTWYALHLGALVMRNFSEFIQVASMPETPQIPVLVLMSLVCIYVIKSGIETFGKWCLIVIPFLITVIVLTVIFGMKDYNYSNLLPVLGENADKIPNAAFVDFTFPFAETVLFTTILSALRKEDSPYKTYFWGLSIGAAIILMGMFRNILLLGIPLFASTYFPSYSAVKLIILGQFISRIEGAISSNFLLAGFVKVSVCLFAGTLGISKLFNIDNYRKMVIPATLIMLTIGLIVYKSTMEMYEWISVYKYYALPFQVILPIIILIFAEIKIRKEAKKQAENSEEAQPMPDDK